MRATLLIKASDDEVIPSSILLYRSSHGLLIYSYHVSEARAPGIPEFKVPAAKPRQNVGPLSPYPGR